LNLQTPPTLPLAGPAAALFVDAKELRMHRTLDLVFKEP
jgi:hypothetical protein